MDTEEIVRRLCEAPSSTANLRNERKAISKILAAENRVEVLELAHRLIQARIPRFAAYEIVLNHKATMETLTKAEVQRLGDGISHWGDIDSFACIVSGPALSLIHISEPTRPY